MSQLPHLRLDIPRDFPEHIDRLNKVLRDIKTWADALDPPPPTNGKAGGLGQPPFPAMASNPNVSASDSVVLSQPDSLFPHGQVLGAGPGITINGTIISSGSAQSNVIAARVSTGSIGAGTTVAVSLTFATPFLDSNFTPVASVIDITSSLQVVDIWDYNSAAVLVNVKNNDAVNDHTGTLCVVAVHD